MDLEVSTDYPINGYVRIRVLATGRKPWKLQLRIPAWSREGSLTVEGVSRPVAAGSVTLEREWQVGDEIELALDVAPRFTYPDPRIDSIRGCAAVERGPIVYCLESVDQPSIDLDRILLEDRAGLIDGPPHRELGPLPTVVAFGREWENELDWMPYGQGPAEYERGAQSGLVLVPYFRWANRGSSMMRVWMPRASGQVGVPVHVGS